MNVAPHAPPRPSLLIIDDEPDVCSFIADVGEGVGYAARIAHDANEVRECLKDPADVVVLDLVMPDMDGVQTLRELADRGARSKIILVSGYDRRVLDTTARLARHLGLRLGAILPKPMRLATLRDALAEPVAELPAAVTHDDLMSVEELRHAIEHQELVVHYQPQVALPSGQWIGVEALVRWQHPTRGLFYPRCFVPVAEASGLALPLTRAILRRALTEFAGVAGALGSDATLSVNVPPAALEELAFPDEAQAMAREAGFDPARVVLEITETTVAADPVKLLDILSRLRMKGFRIAIDDYGTGHSSLEKIRDLPINEIKIDLSFVHASDTDTTAAAIVNNAVQLARSLEVHVVAEGVETPRQWRWLGEIGCHAAQGFFVGRPQPGPRLAEWRSDWTQAPAADYGAVAPPAAVRPPPTVGR
ncbi:MAG TPA: EAL domain-containing response regulator [Candidatus Binatia bacterium]|nr:EAL domain-containing response regulator [Candidatus Binatia bacterium]